MSNQAVIVTGAGSGIGQEIARHFSNQDFFVVLIGKTQSKLIQTQKLLLHPARSAVLPVDLSSETALKQVESQLKKIVNEHPLRTLVNNAGIFHRLSFVDTPLSIWREQFQNNLFSAVHLTSICLPALTAFGTGASIVNISSTLGIRPVANTSAYSAMKAAMINWTQTLALELASTNVRVNCVAPGLVDTPLHGFHNDLSPQTREPLDRMQPLGRIGTPHDIAEAVTYLASDRASWVTGTTLSVDGGISL
jgi:NAD(P)-dependent dehydrogenase (short-subunit alcohol dehydrogenase family)